jgi:hypothetical protein
MHTDEGKKQPYGKGTHRYHAQVAEPPYRPGHKQHSPRREKFTQGDKYQNTEKKCQPSCSFMFHYLFLLPHENN